jgi:hypothetical protein
LPRGWVWGETTWRRRPREGIEAAGGMQSGFLRGNDDAEAKVMGAGGACTVERKEEADAW